MHAIFVKFVGLFFIAMFLFVFITDYIKINYSYKKRTKEKSDDWGIIVSNKR